MAQGDGAQSVPKLTLARPHIVIVGASVVVRRIVQLAKRSFMDSSQRAGTVMYSSRPLEAEDFAARFDSGFVPTILGGELGAGEEGCVGVVQQRPSEVDKIWERYEGECEAYRG